MEQLVIAAVACIGVVCVVVAMVLMRRKGPEEIPEQTLTEESVMNKMNVILRYRNVE